MSKGGGGLGENDVQEFSVRDSSITVKVEDFNEVVDIRLEDGEVVVSEEVVDFEKREGRVGVSVDSLESGVRFEIRLFSEDLSDDFDVFFTISDGFEEMS